MRNIRLRIYNVFLKNIHAFGWMNKGKLSFDLIILAGFHARKVYLLKVSVEYLFQDNKNLERHYTVDIDVRKIYAPLSS